MNRIWKGVFAGSLVGLTAAGAMAITRHRRRMRLLAAERRRKERLHRAWGIIKNNAIRFGMALKSGAEAFVNRWTEKRSWGRA